MNILKPNQFRIHLLLIVLFVANSASAMKVIGVDGRSRWGGVENILSSGSRFIGFRQAILENDYTFVSLNKFDSESLEGLDALILTTPGDYPNGGSKYSFSQLELDAIHKFSNRSVIVGDTSLWSDPGNSVFFNLTSLDNRRFLDNCLNYITERRGVLMMLDVELGTDLPNVQSLVAPYGVRFEEVIHGGGDVILDELGNHPITLGVSSIGINQYMRIETFNSPAIDLVAGNHLPDVIAVIPEPRAAVLGCLGLLVFFGCCRLGHWPRPQ